jgi:hypothetical protein
VKRAWLYLVHTFRDGDHEPTELGMAAAAVAVGMSALTAVVLIENPARSPSWAALIRLGPPLWAWGLGLILLGILQAVGLASRWQVLRRISALCGVLFWSLQLWANIIQGFFYVPFAAVCPLALLAESWVFIQLRRRRGSV